MPRPETETPAVRMAPHSGSGCCAAAVRGDGGVQDSIPPCTQPHEKKEGTWAPGTPTWGTAPSTEPVSCSLRRQECCYFGHGPRGTFHDADPPSPSPPSSHPPTPLHSTVTPLSPSPSRHSPASDPFSNLGLSPHVPDGGLATHISCRSLHGTPDGPRSGMGTSSSRGQRVVGASWPGVTPSPTIPSRMSGTG